MNDHPGLPDGLKHLSEIRQTIGRRKTAFFLDFDGTLAPIASTPDAANMTPEMRRLLDRLARYSLVCVASGRGLTDLQLKVGLPGLYYAADHGFRIAGPEDSRVELEVAPQDNNLELETASYELERRLRDIDGVLIEPKGVSLSVHYRLAKESEHNCVEQIVKEVAQQFPGLRLSAGRLVYDLTPDLGWDKGKAMLWLIKRFDFRRSAVCPICIGDDRTDEDMFSATQGWGVGLVVGCAQFNTKADYCLSDQAAVFAFLEAFAGRGRYA